MGGYFRAALPRGAGARSRHRRPRRRGAALALAPAGGRHQLRRQDGPAERRLVRVAQGRDAACQRHRGGRAGGMPRRGAYLVHLSSGCIYAGDNGGEGFTEDNAPNFAGSFYSPPRRGATRSAQLPRPHPAHAHAVRRHRERAQPHHEVTQVQARADRANSLTYLPDFLAVAKPLIARRATGLYNVVNEGAISPYEVMLRYRQLVDPAHAFEPLDVSRPGRGDGGGPEQLPAEYGEIAGGGPGAAAGRRGGRSGGAEMKGG